MGLLDGNFDPATQGMLAAAFRGLQASGPSRVPVSLGQIIGQAGTAGMDEYQQALQFAQKKKRDDALMALEQQRAAMEKVKMDRALKEQAAIEAFQQQVASGAFTQSPTQQALAGGGGPTPENAGLMAGFKPKIDRTAMLMGAAGTPGLMKEGLAGLMTLDKNALKREQNETLLKMKLQEAAEARDEKSADQKRRDRERFEDQKNLMSFGANLRPPPAIQPLVSFMSPEGPILGTREQAIGKIPAGAGSKEEAKAVGKDDVDLSIITLKNSLDELHAGGGITSTRKGVVPNVGSWVSNTAVGQTLGSMGGTKNQKARDVIVQARPLLLTSIMRATGMTAKQMDSNAELKLWLSTATDPTKGYEANIEALNNIAERFGSGPIVESESIKSKPKRRKSDSGTILRFDAQGNPIQ